MGLQDKHLKSKRYQYIEQTHFKSTLIDVIETLVGVEHPNDTISLQILGDLYVKRNGLSRAREYSVR